MENQKLMDSVSNLPEHEQNTVPSATDHGLLSENITNNCENSVDDLDLVPEKMIDTGKQPSFENTFEVIEDQDSKTFHDIEENNEVIDVSKDKEKENVLENPVASAKIEDFESIQKTESPKEEFIIPEKLETKNTNITKTMTSQKNEPMSTVQPEVKTTDISEIISVVSKKDPTDEGDVCDIKIGPEELFCRIGLGKIIQYST